jgi:hypothetical protein
MLRHSQLTATAKNQVTKAPCSKCNRPKAHLLRRIRIHLHLSYNTFSLIRLCTRYGEFKGPGSTVQTITGSTQGHDPVLLGNSFIFQARYFHCHNHIVKLLDIKTSASTLYDCLVIIYQAHNPALQINIRRYDATFQPSLLADILTTPHDMYTHGRHHFISSRLVSHFV